MRHLRRRNRARSGANARPSQARSGPAAVLACAALLAASACTGCTGANPDYTTDGAVAHAATDMGHRSDLLPPPAQGTQSGTCAGTSARACGPAANCEGGFVPDRVCPMGSTCLGGYCQVPLVQNGSTVGQPCDSEAQCYVSQQTYSYACQPYVVGGKVVFHCGEKVGDGASAAPCKSDSECRSGYCIPSLNTCLRVCAGTDADCPVKNGLQLACRPVRIVVEGVPVKVESCVAP